MDCYCGDDAEYPSIFDERLVQAARDPHECTDCGRAILPGESYRYIWGVWPTIDGAATYLTCARCMVLEEWCKAHVPCYCPMLGALHEAVGYAVGDGEAAAILKPDYDALMADIHAQPKLAALLTPAQDRIHGDRGPGA